MTTITRTVPLLDLHALHAPLRAELMTAMARVLDSERYILGPQVADLEKAVAQYSGARFGIGCASGSDALYLALMASGIGPGDEVFVPAFTFFATAGAVTEAGATPVFVDIDPRTFNIDPERLASAVQAHPKARAVIPVHLFGGCADLDPILETARRYGLTVIEDGAQSIGAEYNHRRAQSIGELGCISFFPTKNLGAMGDGGMIVTGSEGLARKLAALRVHGSHEKYCHEWIGVNSRLDTLQAAVLLVKLAHLDSWTGLRQRNAALYRQLLDGLPLELPRETPYQSRHIYNQFVIRSRERDRLKAYLAAQGIGTEVYYPRPIPLQPCYAHLGHREGDYPESDRASREALALPIHPVLPEDDIRYVCQAIRAFHRN